MKSGTVKQGFINRFFGALDDGPFGHLDCFGGALHRPHVGLIGGDAICLETVDRDEFCHSDAPIWKSGRPTLPVSKADRSRSPPSAPPALVHTPPRECWRRGRYRERQSCELNV